MTLPVITADRVELSPGDELILRFRTWQDYEELLNLRQDRSGLRIRFNAKTQEIRIMSPLLEHGKNADILADLIKCLLRHQGKEWEAFTPITLKVINQQGVEPDYCFYIQNRGRILGKKRIDLTCDPPPDLIIEIDLTSTTKPEDYQAISPPELWIYRNGYLLIYHFEGQEYFELDSSLEFPEFKIKEILPAYINQSWQIGSSYALREFEERLKLH